MSRTQQTEQLARMPLKALIAAVLLAGPGALFAQSSDYELRFPVPKSFAGSFKEPAPPVPPGEEPPPPLESGSGEVEEVAATTLTLAPASLPQADVGIPYSFDLADLLTIGGDEPPGLNEVLWGAEGVLPLNISLDNGVLQGTPGEAGEVSFEVVATHGEAEGRQSYTIVVNGAELRVTQVSVGFNHVCAVTVGGSLVCWGGNAYGELGNGTSGLLADIEAGITDGEGTAALADEYHPVNVQNHPNGIAQLHAENRRTCAVLTSGALWCWGQLPGEWEGAWESVVVPTEVAGVAGGVRDFDAAHNHFCATSRTGGAWCWGSNSWGQGGNSDLSWTQVPRPVQGLSGGLSSIATGATHTCAVSDAGAVYCWGRNHAGQLGNGTTTNSVAPVGVSGLSSGVQKVVAGSYFTCALSLSGGVSCWGQDQYRYGSLGDGVSRAGYSSTPVQVAGLSSGVVDIAASGYSACALTSAGSVLCWGDGSMGLVGDGTSINRLAPVSVTGLASGVAALSGSGLTMCARKVNGQVSCWGNNDAGQRGTGSTGASLVPSTVMRY